MAVFDVGRDLRLAREVPAGLARTWRLSRELLESYAGMGYRVAFVEEQEPERLTAEVTDAQGTKLTARVRLSGQGRGSRVEIDLTGRIAVSGMVGMFATEGKVRSVARERLEGLLERVFGDLSPDPAPPPPHAETAVAAPPARAHVTPPPAAAATTVARPAPSSEGSGSDRPVEERLATLKALHERRLISDEDYKRKKEQILGSL